MNFNSTSQLSDLLFNKLKISTEDLETTIKGYSTAASELEKIKDQHPIVPLLIKYKKRSTLKKMFTKTWIELIHPSDGRIHPSIHNAHVDTGRISISKPNPQQLPNPKNCETEEDIDRAKRIRRAFVAKPGHVLIEADFSQMDLRGLAHLSCDKELCKAFREDADIHTRTAELMGLKGKEGRQKAKAINFGLMYGKSAWGFAKDWGTTEQEATHFLRKYFSIYVGVQYWKNQKVIESKNQGFVTTVLGRRRYIPEDVNLPVSFVPRRGDVNRWAREAAERIAWNSPCQGTTADITKLAMLAVKDYPMLVQIHDSIIFEVLEDGCKEVALDIKSKMENCYKLRVPIVVNISIGKNLADMEEV